MILQRLRLQSQLPSLFILPVARHRKWFGLLVAKDMKLIVIIPIYKRHDLTRLCFHHLKLQQKMFGFDVLVAGSEGLDSRELTESFGFGYIETINDPLGQKLNALSHLCQDYDGMVILGSDDFIPNKAWELYYSQDLTGLKIFGFQGCYFYSTKTKSMNYFKYTGTIKTIGAGRLYTGDLVRKMNGKIWSDDQPKALDTNASNRCGSVGAKEVILDQVTMIDVKHSHNITSHQIARVGAKVNTDIIHRDFGADFYKRLMALQYVSGNDTLNITFKKKELTV